MSILRNPLIYPPFAERRYMVGFPFLRCKVTGEALATVPPIIEPCAKIGIGCVCRGLGPEPPRHCGGVAQMAQVAHFQERGFTQTQPSAHLYPYRMSYHPSRSCRRQYHGIFHSHFVPTLHNVVSCPLRSGNISLPCPPSDSRALILQYFAIF